MATTEERFWAKVTGGDVDQCWEWTGSRAGGGYGEFYVSKIKGKQRKMPAHRWAYETLRVEIPFGLQLDHLCRNRECVNPWHLEPVTHLENNRRGEKAHRTHCPAGHGYSSENTYIASRGDRQCRICIRKRGFERWKAIQTKARLNQITTRQAKGQK